MFITEELKLLINKILQDPITVSETKFCAALLGIGIGDFLYWFTETGAISKERQRKDLKKANCVKFASHTLY